METLIKMTKPLDLQLLTKYIAKSKKIKQNCTRQEKFDIFFCVSVERYCKKVTFGGETGC